MKPTRVWDLVMVAVTAAIAAWLLARGFYGSFPPIAWFAGASLYPVVAIEVVLAFMIRSRIEKHRIGDMPGQIHPITAARAAALAKASALVGAAVGGVWAGFLVHVVPRGNDVQAAAADVPGAWVGLGAAVALLAAGLWLEHCCRAPHDQDDSPS
ncbi:DUF3180 domain-containing protein [Rhodococcus rhodnii]|uniref:DUF3180 domain-containing protein n=2 Tax=Rhodococcus rhodnii TaxID=38312 RepID=R7WSD8_9NOCA|nr:DUF3180 domain-containing protein [Rhodococcus rhodnii]EOM78267.1 hypothetical protein Rrhod_0352 [Rhodococcus rhodnii LMG 5362]TXG92317.1 DUF3180 domain-containing protein [Rhodococcus rhodnii]